MSKENNNQVFDQRPVTNTRTPVPDRTDCRILTNGSMANWAGIPGLDFLPGQEPGQEQVCIKNGDQSAKVMVGRRVEDIQQKLSFRVRDGHSDDELQFDINRATIVNKNDTLTVGEDQKLTVVRDQKVTVTNDQTVSVTNKRNVDARHISEYGKETIVINAGVELVIQGPGGSIKIDSTGVTIQGVIVKIN